MQYGIQLRLAVRVGIRGLGQHPRRLFVNIFVRAAHQNPDFLERHVERELVHLRLDLRRRADGDRLQLRVNLVTDCRNRVRHHAAVVFFDHGNRPRNKIAEAIRQHHLIGKHPVLSERVLTQQEIFQSVDAVTLDQNDRIDHIVALARLGLGDFFPAQKQPAMSEYLLRQRQTRAHQHRRPDDRVETHDFLPHQMHVGRPIFVVKFSVVRIAQSRNVVCQRVQPYINDMLFVERHRDTPVKGRTRNAKIVQSLFDEGNHFVAA